MEAWTPDDLKSHLDNGDKVFLKLWKKGCGICKLSNSATDRLEKTNEHGLVFGKISLTDHPEMAAISETDMLPAFFVFEQGKKKGVYTGFKGLDKLKTFVDEALQG